MSCAPIEAHRNHIPRKLSSCPRHPGKQCHTRSSLALQAILAAQPTNCTYLLWGTSEFSYQHTPTPTLPGIQACGSHTHQACVQTRKLNEEEQTLPAGSWSLLTQSLCLPVPSLQRPRSEVDKVPLGSHHRSSGGNSVIVTTACLPQRDG